MNDILMGEMRGYISAIIEPHRPRGMKSAWSIAARMIGVTPRRVRAILNGEALRISAAEFIRAQQVHAEQLQQRAAVLRAELERIERKQGKIHAVVVATDAGHGADLDRHPYFPARREDRQHRPAAD